LRSRDILNRNIAMVALGIRGGHHALEEVESVSGVTYRDFDKLRSISAVLLSGVKLHVLLDTACLDSKVQVRAASYFSIAVSEKESAIIELLSTLADRREDGREYSARGRAYAIWSLASIDVSSGYEQKAVTALARALKSDDDYFVRASAALVLSRFKCNRMAFEAVRAGCYDRHADVAAMSIISLGYFDNPVGIGDIRKALIRSKGTELANAAWFSIGLAAASDNTENMIYDYINLKSGDEMSAAAYAIAHCANDDTWNDILTFCSDENKDLRENSIKCIGMMHCIPKRAGSIIIEALKLRKTDTADIAFLAAVVRASLGDRTGVADMIEAERRHDFKLVNSASLDDFSLLMELPDTMMPEHYKMKPFVWGDGAQE
jgi:hypothetical protein